MPSRAAAPSVSGWWQAGAAVAIIAPGLPLLKEWAYAGIFFLWSGAVVSHLAAGDGPETWRAPLMFPPSPSHRGR